MVVDAWYAEPSILYSSPVPVGADMLMVPVGVLHVGCTVILAVGATGGAGTLFTVSNKAAETQPVEISFTVTL